MSGQLSAPRRVGPYVHLHEDFPAVTDLVRRATIGQQRIGGGSNDHEEKTEYLISRIKI